MQHKDQRKCKGSTLLPVSPAVTGRSTGHHSDVDCVGISARIFEIQKYSIHDGPGIRTTVFFKGCPLDCLWCSNPESQRPEPEVMLRATKCIQCNRCLIRCQQQALSLSAGQVTLDRSKCDDCLQCRDECPSGAIQVAGRTVVLEYLVREVERDRLFYQHSGGGVTASGGEPLMQWKFLKCFFDACRRSGISTALDTCGYASREALEGVLEYTDLVLFDVKHLDPQIHQRFTGQENGIILDNLRFVASRKRTWVRFPLIPGVNDSMEDLRGIAQLAADLKVEKVSILPYHALGEVKYRQLGREYRIQGTPFPSPGEIEKAKTVLEGEGVPVSVSY